MFIANEIVSAIIGLLATIISVFLTYYFTREKSKKEVEKCKEKYVDDKLKDIIEIYQTEVKQLRADIRKLTEENSLLRNEILDLKNRVLQNIKSPNINVSKQPSSAKNKNVKNPRK
jgi:predicted RNase H-like nuclease (RuvC/YqgF family)